MYCRKAFHRDVRTNNTYTTLPADRVAQNVLFESRSVHTNDYKRIYINYSLQGNKKQALTRVKITNPRAPITWRYKRTVIQRVRDTHK